MTTIKVLARKGVGFFDRVVKEAEAALKDARTIIKAYNLKQELEQLDLPNPSLTPNSPKFDHQFCR